MTDEETKRSVELLADLMQVAGMSRQEVHRRLEAGRGLASPLLGDGVELQLRNIMSVLKALDIEALTFFRILFPDPDERPPKGDLMERITRRLEEAGYAKVEDAEPPPAAPDPEELERQVLQYIRDVLEDRPDAGSPR